MQKSSQPRRESDIHGSTGATGLRPPAVKHRAYSAPMVAEHQANGSDTDDMPAHRAGEHADDEEIAGDEFFQRYHFPQSAKNGKASGSSADSSSDTEGPMSPTHVRTRIGGPSDSCPSPRSPAPSIASGHSDSAPAMQDLNIAVLGTRGTGKSTFIRRALNLPDTGSSSVCTRKMTIDGGYYMVRFVEMAFDHVQIVAGSTLRWPDTIDGLEAPRIDGAVTMYDVTNKLSLTLVPEILHVLSKSGLPFILVAAKCDQHPREVDPATVEEKARKFPGDVNAFQTSADQPETQRGCLSVITRAVIACKRPPSQASMARRRANSSAVRSSLTKDPWGRKHERASSEFSARYRPRSSETSASLRYKPGESNKTFFDFEEEAAAQDSNGSDFDISDGGEVPSDDNGYTFDQLVDRLLAQPLSKTDSRFVSIFLALYRRFATPGQLLEAVLKRFESFRRQQLPPMIRVIDQLRTLGVLQQWVSFYPGDFAFPSTRKSLRKFAATLSTNREFAVAAKEILQDLEVITEDDDTEWACNDKQRLSTDSAINFHTVLDEDSEDDDFTRALGNMSMSSSERLSIARSSMTANSRNTLSSTGSVSSTQTLLHWVERHERQARLLVPNPMKPLSKIQWQQILTESESSIARELTRIDWIMFSSIRPRDFVRHVSANADEKKKYKSLENVTRMSEHFNHVAYLVANYILLREKARHRAEMMEKWMKVARELRKLNNYNTLGAVIAGIKNASVYRLKETSSLLPQQVGHDFTRLEMLMNTTKGSAAYRLAWENSSSERIPFIPLHRGDLVSASEGNSTFIADKARQIETSAPHPGTNVFPGGASNRTSREAPLGGVSGKERINWRKFDIMGQTVVSFQRAQGTPYPNWVKNDEIRNLILDVKIIKDEDDLYDRSVQLEAAASGEKKKLFNWIRER
ncbi:ras GEF [Massarina eburnea CBS 473.64]|uniref:Ras GEF n=1 Tax=Massarina eburnea CBS 473.64 TaxID=1395130 RepID=A0A6A6RQD2_9PLEO|nr:ras GEF [Massarina eburnea CBS 473.64]